MDIPAARQEAAANAIQQMKIQRDNASDEVTRERYVQLARHIRAEQWPKALQLAAELHPDVAAALASSLLF